MRPAKLAIAALARYGYDMATPLTATEIADRADELKAAFVGVVLAMPALLDSRLPILDVHCRLYGQTPEAPVEIRRNDGTLQSSRPIREHLRNVADLQGGGMREDILSFAGMHGATRLGDHLDASKLYSQTEPLLQFARHLRNACAHGNQWHFRGQEPRFPSALRGYILTQTEHGKKAIWGTVGPGEYLDFLDDLSALLRAK